MLQFFSASTNIVNSKRAITECLENALEGQGSLDCDLIIIYSAMGHNFKDLLTEARRLSPDARITGCTGAGIIGKDGPNESLKALAIMDWKKLYGRDKTRFPVFFIKISKRGPLFSWLKNYTLAGTLIPAALARSSALSVRSQVNSGSERPKWP